MAHLDPSPILERFAAAARGPGATPADVELWTAVNTATGRLGAAQVRDSARRSWSVEPHRDAHRGRFVVFRPVHGDNEPFRASADGHRPEAYLPITADEWTVLALLAHGGEEVEGRADDELRRAAFVLVNRMVIEAQHKLLTGAAEDEDEDEG
jgi:hypothetical protein